METQPSRSLDFNPYTLPKEYLEVIGLVAASATQTDECIQSAISAILETDMEMGWAITTHMAQPQKDQCLRAIAEIQLTDPDVLDELDKILNSVAEAMTKRNAIVHNYWCHDTDTNEVFQVKTSARGSVKTDLLAIKIEDIRADAKFIYEAGLNITQFLITHKINIKPPPTGRYRGDRTKEARKKRAKE